MDPKSETKLTANKVSNYQEWFISALKSTKVSDDGNIEDRSLLQNCVSCHNEIKKLLEKNDKDWIVSYEEFRSNSTIIILLCCSSIKSVSKISLSKDLQSLIKSLPTISESQAFLVIQSLKNYRFLRGILPWLPVSALLNLTTNFFVTAKVVTPISLAISYELLVGLLNSLMYERENICCELIDLFDILLEFFNSRDHKFDTDSNIKVEAYFFLYLFKSLSLFIKLLVTKTTEELTNFSLGLQLKNLYLNTPKIYPIDSEEIIKDFVKQLAKVTFQIFPLITSNIWIDWYSIRLPPLDPPNSQPHKTLLKADSEELRKSVQLEIANTAFRINKLILDNPIIIEILTLQEFPDFLLFLEHISIDPDHDSDNDFSNDELLAYINESEEKRKKYVNILFSRDNVFDSSTCLSCAMTYGSLMRKDTIISLLLKIIHSLKSNTLILDDWVEIVLDIAKRVPVEDISLVIRNELNNGKENLLKTKNFQQDVTFVFNQVSESQDSEYDSLFAWLCLQDGREVVRQFIEHVLSLSGMASVAASALKVVYFVCQAEDEEGCSVLTTCLTNNWNVETSENGRKEFQSLVLKLLEKQSSDFPKIYESEYKIGLDYLDTLPIRVHEVLDFFILPKLKYEDYDAGPYIPIVIELLKTIIILYPDCIVDASPKFTSLIVSLILLYNNCNYLSNPNYSTTLTLRNSIQYVIIEMIKQVNERREDFKKVISFVNYYISKYNLHTRCLLLLSPLIDIQIPESLSVSDDIFCHIFWSSAGPIFSEKVPQKLPPASRMQWVWSLSIHLPNCSSEEWTQALKLTHLYINQSAGYSSMVIPTLKIFQEVLFLICATTNSVKVTEEDLQKETEEDLQKETEEDLQSSENCLISVDCCFKSFSIAATSFISEEIKEEASEQQFFILVNIFNWWCKSFKGFTCNPELPCIFLSSLSNLIQDLFSSEYIKVTMTSELENIKNKHFLDEISNEIQNQGCIDPGNYDQDVHFKIFSERSTCAQTKLAIEPTNRPQPKKITPEFLCKVRFVEKIELMVKTFIVCVPPNTVGSMVAGKLKSVYEINAL